jgi:hypothetical protein
MIVYVPNDDVAPIMGYLRRCTLTVKPEPEQSAALARMEKHIEYEKKGKPYQMWSSNKEERHVDDSVASAAGVGVARPARRNRVRKSHSKRK